MIKKIKACVSFWVNNFLSCGGIFFLFKSVLKIIPVYWVCIVAILKGILNRIWKFGFRYLRDSWGGLKGTHLANFYYIASSEEIMGWGLKDINIFTQALVGKSLWRMIVGSSLRCKVLQSKYFPGKSVKEWIREPHKSMREFIVLKDLVQSFPLFKECVPWKIGNGKFVLHGQDPWIRVGNSFKIYDDLIYSLRNQILV